jgi:hypothetical protein
MPVPMTATVRPPGELGGDGHSDLQSPLGCRPTADHGHGRSPGAGLPG